MFGLDPLSRPVAIAEILLLLAFAALVGWLLGRLVLNGRIRTLRTVITDKQAELDDCRRSLPTRSGVSRSEATVIPARDPLVPLTYAAPQSGPVIETPATHVPADPLLPAFGHDDSPGRSDEPVDLLDPVVTDVTRTDRSAVERFDDLGSGRSDGPVDSPVAVSAITTEMPVPGNSEAAVLNRIAARASEVNFDRIGRSTAAEADDLKDIVGVGPFLERKLHSLGIYTFRQVANFTKEDADKVNNLIEFFPGRIERDNWVDQASAFHERKYGQRNQSHD